MASAEVYDGTTWIKLVNSQDLQAAMILPVIATGTNSAKAIITQVDGVVIPVGGMFLLTSQSSATDNGVYTFNSDKSVTKLSPQPMGVYVMQGTTKANNLFFNMNNSQVWTQFLVKATSKKRK